MSVSVTRIQKNRCRTTIAERKVETRAELPFIGDQVGLFRRNQAARSGPATDRRATAIASAASKGAGIVIRGGAAKGAPSEGKQAGLQWERWRRAPDVRETAIEPLGSTGDRPSGSREHGGSLLW